MLRKPLKTSTGCLRCRQRRIKCDEEHPVCARCKLWKFDCFWPAHQESKSKFKDKESDTDNTKALLALTRGKRALPLQCYQDGYMAAGYQNFDNAEQRQLVESAVEFVRRYTSHGISSDRGGLPFLMTLVLQTPWSRPSLSAFTAGSISRWDDRFNSVALNSFQAALIELRLNLSSDTVSNADVRILTSMFFLGLFEVPNPFELKSKKRL